MNRTDIRPTHKFVFSAGERVLRTESGAAAELEMRYFVNDDAVAKLLWASLSAAAADLVDVAMAVHIADRLALRGGERDIRPERRFHLRFPVRLLPLWQGPDVQQSLSDVLTFSTGDRWDIEFSQREPRPRFAEQQDSLFSVRSDEAVRVNLFSGGLDSFAGNAVALSEHRNHHYVCVSVTSSPRQGERQAEQVRRLRNQPHKSLTHLQFPASIKAGSGIEQEQSRRTRGFLFLALGAVSALSAGVESLFLYENGIGAINLPYERTPVGIPNSRSVHPGTLFRMSRFIEILMQKPFRIENPCVFKTKGEMCGHPIVRSAPEAIRATFSCDGFPVRHATMPQCGKCTSCILRRLALDTCGMHAVDQDGYVCDLFNLNQQIRSGRLRGLCAMNFQVERLGQALDGGKGGWRSFVSEFPQIRLACTALAESTGEPVERLQQELLRLYGAHCAEWARFAPRQWTIPQRKAA
jgi:7-cyano-7-deazaguanine synthase in queuosine biosynthesis